MALKDCQVFRLSREHGVLEESEQSRVENCWTLQKTRANQGTKANMRPLDTARAEIRQLNQAIMGFIDTLLSVKITNLYCLTSTTRKRRFNIVENTFWIYKFIVSSEVLQNSVVSSQGVLILF